jgi:hydroxymethylglutaryl-CoA lyase
VRSWTRPKGTLLQSLSRSGLRRIEATSFVNPKVVPQVADAVRVMRNSQRQPGVRYEALVPNVHGAQEALAAGADAVP